MRFLLVLFFVRMWLLKACFLLIFPVPVKSKRFLAAEFVFIFGIFDKVILVRQQFAALQNSDSPQR